MGNYVVTGAEGFIGKRLADTLLKAGHKVAGLVSLGEVRMFMHPDITPEGRSGADGIFHMGAISDTRCTDLRALMAHNVNCTDQLFQWCTWNKVPLVYASSAATYGTGYDGGPGKTSVLPKYHFSDIIEPEALNPLNDYAWSKNEADRRVFHLDRSEIAPPRWYGCKLFNVYGPGEDHKAEMASFQCKAIRALQRGEKVKLFDVLDAKRDFIHVDDAVDAMIWLMHSKAESGLYNIGTGEAATFASVASEIITAMHSDADCISDYNEIIPTPDGLRGYQMFTQADISSLRAVGYERKFRDALQGARDYVEALRAASTSPHR